MGHPNKFDGMMNEYCVGLGWCGSFPLHVTDFVPAAGSVSADDFVDWLIRAEQADLRSSRRARQRLRDVFVRHMGAEAVDASELRSKWFGR